MHTNKLDEQQAFDEKDVVKKVTDTSAILKEHELLSQFFSQAPAMFAIIKGPTHIYEFANEEYIQNIGNRNPVGKTLKEALPELEGQGFHELLDNVYNTGKPYVAKETPANLQQANGKVVTNYFSLSFQAVRKADGDIEGVSIFAYNVTEQVVARKQVEDSELRFRIALKGASHTVFSQDVNLKHTWIYNPHPSATVEKIIGKDDYELHEPVTAALLGGLKKQVLETGEPLQAQVPVNIHGEQTFHDIVIEPEKDKLGKVTGITGVVVNVTESVLATKKLEASELRLHLALESGKLGSYEIDLVNNTAFYSERFLTIFGLNPFETYNRTDLVNVIYPEDLPVRAAAHKQALVSGSLFYEARVVWYDKSLHWVRFTGQYIFENNIPVRIYGTAQNITEEKEAAEKLRESEERFRIMADAAPNIVWVLHPDGRQKYINKYALNYLGLTEQQATDMDWSPLIHPDDLASTTKAVTEALGQKTPYSKEHRLLKYDGTYSWFLSQGVPSFYPNGELYGYVGSGIDITESKIKEQGLRESEERFEAAVSAVQGILWTNNAIGQMEGEQPGWESLTGQTFDEYQGFGWATAVHPDDRDASVKAWQQTVLLKQTYVFVHRLKLKDGTWGHFSIRAVPLLNEDGSIRQWVGVHTNITERRQAEIALAESELRFRSFANSIPQLTWMAGADNEISWYNERWSQYTGADLEEMKRLGKHAFVHPSMVQSVTDKLDKAMAEGRDWEDTFLLRSKTGEYRWFLSRAIAVRNVEGAIVQWFGTKTDITDQQNTSQALRESEARFKLLSDIMPQLIWTADEKGTLNYFNEAVYNYSGLSHDDIKYGGWLEIVHPEERAENTSRWQHAVATGEDFFMEHRFKSHTGEYRWKLSRAVAYKNNAGEIQLWVGTSTDIQDQKLKEQKQDEFLSIASHEMKTPLTSAKGYLQLLDAMPDKNGDNAQSFLKKSGHALSRLNELINELLDASKIKHGKLEYSLTDFDFDELINNTIIDMQYTSHRHVIIKKGLQINKLNGDKNRLQQVLINLLNNAIKYSPVSKEIIIDISTTKTAEGNFVQVSVTDKGVGIGQHNLEKIFERYYRVEEQAGLFKGLGIGLFISHEIVQRHGGKLWAVSEVGKGSTFTFTLPV